MVQHTLTYAQGDMVRIRGDGRYAYVDSVEYGFADLWIPHVNDEHRPTRYSLFEIEPHPQAGSPFYTPYRPPTTQYYQVGDEVILISGPNREFRARIIAPRHNDEYRLLVIDDESGDFNYTCHMSRFRHLTEEEDPE